MAEYVLDATAVLPADVEGPGYDRGAVRAGIAHIGVGGFHRSHQAMYVDRLLNAGGDAREWGICGIGLLEHDARMRDALAAQDELYTLVLKSAGGVRQARVIGSIVEYVYAPDDRAAAVERLTDPAIRIVSMTVTEGGYNVHRATGEFDAQGPGIQDDLATPGEPRTVFGLVVEALRLRRERGVDPFTVMSCDNIPGNGSVARGAFMAFARMRDAELSEWIGEQVAFPNSMVDRITPVTAQSDIDELRERFGVVDAWPVVAEPWEQWVLEDHFPTGRPAFEQVGVQMVDDVIPYELMKLRLLNCTHQAMAYFGHLFGYVYAHEAVADPLIRRLLVDYMDREATPTLPPVPGIDLVAYKASLLERYANPDVRDTLARLCADTTDRIPTWMVPVVREQLDAGGEVRLCAAIVASWARYAEGIDEEGRPIEVVDRLRDRVVAAALRDRQEPGAFLDDRELFGDLRDDSRFVDAYVEAVGLIRDLGAREALRRIVGESAPS
ncbi:mannitol 2-dehydrogenase [Microbacterium sp. W4I4]|uniref:mannitol dehydrogenase family protein n=1 Tax=Microbacterium sp. W4I4 TaxID=3042295 RepID=UPI002782FA72|nr:mannitol dehydrogenase family protein [Microbacterium sp. W4I4]MDQ0614429.1 mannitol 2-dehydrogenase [Microbacterium sp. W4I4]